VLIPVLVAVVALVASARLTRQAVAPTPPPVQFVLAATDSTRPFDNFPWPAAISPDGGTVVYSVARTATTGSLYALRTDQLEAREIPGTVNAYQAYFSPDGKWLAFEAGGKERRVRLDGSTPVTIADATGANGADWTTGNEIVLGAQGRFHGLSHVTATGGVTAPLTSPDSARGERDHLWPIGTPDGKAIVFAIWSGTLTTSRLAMTSSEGGAVAQLGIHGIRPLAVLDGMLVYVQADGGVMAVRLDEKRRKAVGSPIPVHDPVSVVTGFNGNSGIFVSRGGALVASRGGTLGKLAWLTRDGRAQPVAAQPRSFIYARLSPDEHRIAAVLAEGSRRDVWIYDLVLGTFSRLTSSGTVSSVEWSADGSRVVYVATGETLPAVWSQQPSGGTQPEKLFQHTVSTITAVMSPDGGSLLLNSIPGVTWELMQVPLDSQRTARPYLAAPGAGVHAAQFAPGGKWVALASEETGNDEVYVRSYPDPSSKIQVSVGGGAEPVWSADGSRLYYRSGSALLSARVALSPEFRLLGRDTVLVNTTTVGSFFSGSYQPTRDGKRILAILPDRDDYQLVVSPFWITELRRRIAEAGGRP
jgi:eukaryotic-like serine/threonine-protein kinase